MQLNNSSHISKSHSGALHDQSDEAAHRAFIDQFSKQQIPTDIPVYDCQIMILANRYQFFCIEAGLVILRLKYLIKQNAIKFDGVAITHLPTFESECILQVGKRRFVKFIVAV